jgi:hypothetical protein
MRPSSKNGLGVGGLLATPVRVIESCTDKHFDKHHDASKTAPTRVVVSTSAKTSTEFGNLEAELLLRQIEAREAIRRGPGKMNLLDGTAHCTLEACSEGARITFGGAPFCLNHFILRCYDSLDQLDPRIRSRRGVNTETNNLRESVEECSNRALLVSLRSESLSNLDRSRLLDILLWSSELQFLLNMSARDFDLLAAFRQGSELAAPTQTTPSPQPSKQAPDNGAQNL